MTSPKLQIQKLKSNLKLTIVIVIVIVIVIIGLAVYFTWPEKPEEEILPEEEFLPEEEISAEQKEFLESQQPGDVGELEIKEGQAEEEALGQVNPEALERPVRPPGTAMPPAVFDTKGEIVSIGEDRITVIGSGENFEDQKPRTLTVIFSDQTTTFEKGQKIRYNGLEGLNHLKAGENILISTSENIRGKTEFQASYINKI